METPCGTAYRPMSFVTPSTPTDNAFSEFVYANMPVVDGLLYRSRLTERFCIAIYDRARVKLTVNRGPRPLARTMLVQALASWNVTVR